ncbi:hypothetical protein GGH95_001920, partial [Coemansia sp. RSA 1836]
MLDGNPANADTDSLASGKESGPDFGDAEVPLVDSELEEGTEEEEDEDEDEDEPALRYKRL